MSLVFLIFLRVTGFSSLFLTALIFSQPFLFLIFSFVNAAGIFLLAGAEFLALILVIVYVGAVAVLFLFVIMMLDFNIENIKKNLNRC